MKNKENNFAYIDGANLHKGVGELGWKLDYKKFRIWLTEKYNITTAYIFLGFIGGNSDLYRDLQKWGYVVILKPTLPNQEGEVKGNCDAENEKAPLQDKTYMGAFSGDNHIIANDYTMSIARVDK